VTPRTGGDTLNALFCDGQLRLAENGDGWEGFVREKQDGETTYVSVDTRPYTPPLRKDVRFGEHAVRETVQERLKPDRWPLIADGRGD
jgi:hypothetical protein